MISSAPPPQSKETELDWIAWSSLQGALGLFVGTGFSKAATAGRAPGFEELLRQLADRLGVPSSFDSDPTYKRKSLPQIASLLLEEFARKGTLQKRAATDRFREEIAQLCYFMPESAPGVQLRAALRATAPAWIITTNYDLVIESLLEECESVLASQPLAANTSRVPVYHLHGSRRSPSTIKITEEDYVSLLGPIDYQRLKLPLLILESTTVMLGYALGDINVRAAMAWSKSFRGERGLRLEEWQGRVVQALFSPTPKPEPYEGPNGEVVVEISDIASFLESIGQRRQYFEQASGQIRGSIESFLSDPDNAIAVATDQAKRNEFLGIIKGSFWLCDSDMLISFVDQALQPIWSQAMQLNQFSHYVDYLRLVLDIIEPLALASIRPGMLTYLGDALDKVGAYIDPNKGPGTAWAATDLWQQQYCRIQEDVRRELLSYAVACERSSLQRMLSVVATGNAG